MRPQYLAFVGTTPEVIGLNTDCETFQVLVRCSSGVTLEGSIDWPDDSLTIEQTPRENPVAPVWTAIVLDANGYANLTAAAGIVGTGFAPGPWRALRFTPAAGGNATVLQQGIK